MKLQLDDDAVDDVAALFIKRCAEQMLEAETVGGVFDCIEAIEDMCEQLRAVYRALDAEPPR